MGRICAKASHISREHDLRALYQNLEACATIHRMSGLGASGFWDREIVEPTHVSWMANTAVREYINTCISGAPSVWPMDWFERFLSGRVFKRGLSIGCGGGPLERDLLRRNICEHIDAFDGSPQSIAVAKDEAAKAGVALRVNYWVGDFNNPRLPSREYDIVFFHQSLHHVAKLEKLLRSVRRCLTRDGIIYLDEFVGPSRTDWNDQTIALQRSFFAMLQAEESMVDALPLPIQPDDPSEAIRSGEIIKQLGVGFDTLEFREYGGILLSVLFPIICSAGNREPLVELLLAAEKALRAGATQPFHAVIVAEPKRGLRGFLADTIYYCLPKLKRIRREIASRVPIAGAGGT